MKDPNESFYALVCMMILLDGYEDKSPAYAWEKLNILSAGMDAFVWLDWKNQARAIEYCRKWGVAVPCSWVLENKKQMDAARALGLET